MTAILLSSILSIEDGLTELGVVGGLKVSTLPELHLQKLPLSGAELDKETGVIKGAGIAFDVIHEIQKRVGFYYNITMPDQNTLGNENVGVMKLLKSGVS